MGLSYSDMRRFDDKLDEILAKVGGSGSSSNDAVLAAINQLRIEMDQRLKDVIDKMAEIKAETGQYIADRDARDEALNATIAEKDAKIADLTAQLAAGQITIQEFQAGLDEAKAAANAAADLLPAVRVPDTVPVPDPLPEPTPPDAPTEPTQPPPEEPNTGPLESTPPKE